MKKRETRSPAESLLDRAIELTFPASDPVAVEHAFGTARKRDQARAGENARPRRARSARSGGAKSRRKGRA